MKILLLRDVIGTSSKNRNKESYKATNEFARLSLYEGRLSINFNVIAPSVFCTYKDRQNSFPSGR